MEKLKYLYYRMYISWDEEALLLQNNANVLRGKNIVFLPKNRNILIGKTKFLKNIFGQNVKLYREGAKFIG